MNSAERFLTALRGQVPDRVPIFELYIHPDIIEALIPGATLPEFVESMELDAISSLWMTDGTIAETWIDDRTTVDEWGVTWRYGAENRGPIAGPIQTLDDVRHYTPPDPDAPHRLANLREYIARFKGKKAVIYQQRFGFMWAADLRRFDNFLIDCLENPQLVHELLEIANDFAIKLARNAVRAGADAVVFGDDLAFKTGPLMSPMAFKEFMLPRLSRAVEAVKAEGALCIMHSDGNLWKLLDMIVDTGVDGVNPLEPVAGMDIGEVKRKYGDRVCLLGNIDCGELLSQGSVEEVERTVKETIRVAAPGGGYIMSSSNAIHSAVKPENYRAMIEAAKRYGKYPL
ncbi:MAG: uroporphyrinogen decarboxylase family protein, partial [Anaerolineae bacterium]